jgi:hypothetical protein
MRTERPDRLLEAGLVTDDVHWDAGPGTLWFIGDFLDRGPKGAGAIHMAMRLQEEATGAGGAVGALLGNHELILIALDRFGRDLPELQQLWLMNGGRESDVRSLTAEDIEWIASLPAAAVVGDDLLVHADSDFYLDYGGSVEEVNERIGTVLKQGDREEVMSLLHDSFRRFELADDGAGNSRLERMLGMFGARRVIHGHTPIPVVTGQEPAQVTHAFEYAEGRCLNVDGGMYLGGLGFVAPLGAGSED